MTERFISVLKKSQMAIFIRNICGERKNTFELCCFKSFQCIMSVINQAVKRGLFWLRDQIFTLSRFQSDYFLPLRKEINLCLKNYGFKKPFKKTSFKVFLLDLYLCLTQIKFHTLKAIPIRVFHIQVRVFNKCSISYMINRSKC